jgi:uncharacterized BrkB/YihY/UPF0761 family membrane protein
MLAAFGLLVFSMLFSWHAASFGRFNETDGSLGAVIACMTWMWLSAVIILEGAGLNSEIETQARPGEGSGQCNDCPSALHLRAKSCAG